MSGREVTEAEMAADAEETFAHALTMRARAKRARGQGDMAREYQGLAAGHCGMAAELRELDAAMWQRIEEVRAM